MCVRSAPAHGTVDLATVLRPRLDSLQAGPIQALASTAGVRGTALCQAELAHRVARYLLAHREQGMSLEGIALNRALASTCTTQDLAGADDQRQVLDVVRTVFVAAAVDDVAKFDSIIAPGFYLYDVGARFNGDTIMQLIKAQHAAGRRYEWNVTEPDVHVSGNTAWAAYVNRGSIGDTSGTVPVQWLESAILEKQDGAWKIAFMHSTRVTPPQGK